MTHIGSSLQLLIVLFFLVVTLEYPNLPGVPSISWHQDPRLNDEGGDSEI